MPLIVFRKTSDIEMSIGEPHGDSKKSTLTDNLITEQGDLWRAENAKAIHAYNSFIEESGVFSDGLREF